MYIQVVSIIALLDAHVTVLILFLKVARADCTYAYNAEFVEHQYPSDRRQCWRGGSSNFHVFFFLEKSLPLIFQAINNPLSLSLFFITR